MTTARRNAAFSLPVLAAMLALPAATQAQPVNDKMVWVHQMSNMPNDPGMQYGSTYPINLYDRSNPVARANAEKQTVRDLTNAGIKGVAFEITPGKLSRAPGVPQYAATVRGFAGSGMLVAPCIDVGKSAASPDDVVEAIEQSYAVAKANANPALMADGRLIVFLYSANNQPPDVWARIRAKVAADGYKIFLVGDAGQANVGVAKALGNTSALVANWDAAYNFSGVGMAGAADSNASFNRTVAARNKSWIGSLLPGYYRGINVSAWGPFNVDALGTARLRSVWQDILQSNISWVYWITQNDFVEHTNLMPDSTWGYTRSDMNLWYARQLTRSPYPYGAALYLTTPQSLHVGDTAVVELAVVNPLGTPLSATVQLVADNGDVLGSGKIQVAAHRLDAVQIAVPASAAASHAYARAIARGPTGSITSAPILLSKEMRSPRDHGGTGYYSTNSRLTLPKGWAPAIAAQGSDVRLSGIDPSLILSADLLASGNLVDQIKFPPSGPITLRKTQVLTFGRDSNDNKNSVLYAAAPVYLVRIVLKTGAIWYSTPLPAN